MFLFLRQYRIKKGKILSGGDFSFLYLGENIGVGEKNLVSSQQINET